MKLRKVYTCPVELVHDMIRGKWKAVILYQINHHGRAYLSQLERDIKGISQKMLLEQLKELLEVGLIEKVVYEGYPLKVDYQLTENRGKKLYEALEIMQSIGLEYLEDLKE